MNGMVSFNLVMPPESTSRVFLLIVATVPLVWAVSKVLVLRANGFTSIQIVLFVLNYFYARIFWGAVVVRKLPLPSGQGAVVVSNHRSSVDPFFIQLGARGPVHWMVAREYFVHPLFGWFLRVCQAIPVGRGGVDTAATKLAIRLVAEGGFVGMFPEGRINMTDELLMPARPGAVLVAVKARVPIVPCYIKGSPFAGTPLSPFRMQARVTVQFGDRIDLTPYYDGESESSIRQQILTDCMAKIAAMAGHPDYPVRMAGRNWKPSREEVESDIAAAQRRIRRR